jgi:hypothetical protein
VKFFQLFLLFVTLWILIIGGFIYLVHRRRPGVVGACCLEIPCSESCAREHQSLRDRDSIEYHKIVRELGNIVQAGRELESAPEPALIPPPDSSWSGNQAN